MSLAPVVRHLYWRVHARAVFGQSTKVGVAYAYRAVE